jgi:hypothetical protein
MKLDLKGRLGDLRYSNGLYHISVVLSQTTAGGESTHLLDAIRLTKEQAIEIINRDPFAGDIRATLSIEVPGSQATGNDSERK